MLLYWVLVSELDEQPACDGALYVNWHISATRGGSRKKELHVRAVGSLIYVG